MKLAARLMLGLVLLVPLLAPLDAGAVMDDMTYCRELYDLAVKYRGGAIMGDTKPTIDELVALDLCKNGNTKEGIAMLENKLTGGKVSLPPR